MNTKAKPNVTELGPYYYREHKNKTNVTFTDNGKVVKYKLHDVYVFDRTKTASHLDPDKDLITCLNVPYMAVVDQYIKGKLNYVELLGLKALAKDPSVFIRHTVTELVWGYQDSLTEFLHKDNELPSSTFGLFANDSSSDWGSYSSVRTGIDDLNSVGQFLSWRGKNNLSYWNGTYANMINGTDGTFFHPHLHNQEDVVVFVDSLYRSTNLTHQANVSQYSISLYRYVIPKWELQNSTVYSANSMWYANWFWGLLNLSAPLSAPVFMSKPHFLDADPEFLTNVTGMKNPEAEQDDTMMDAEPLTGFVFNVHKRLQVNVRLQQHSTTLNALGVSNVRDTLVPVAYIDQTASANKTTCDEFRDKVYKPIEIVNDVRWGLVGLGGAMTAVSVILLGYWMFRSRKRGYEPLSSLPRLSTQDV